VWLARVHGGQCDHRLQVLPTCNSTLAAGAQCMVGDVTMDWALPDGSLCVMPSRHGIVVLTLSQRSSLCSGAQERGAPHASAATAVKTAHLLVFRWQALAAARPFLTGWRLPQAAFPEPGVKNFRVVVVVPKARPGSRHGFRVGLWAPSGERVSLWPGHAGTDSPYIACISEYWTQISFVPQVCGQRIRKRPVHEDEDACPSSCLGGALAVRMRLQDEALRAARHMRNQILTLSRCCALTFMAVLDWLGTALHDEPDPG